jgi:hypothetical protein
LLGTGRARVRVGGLFRLQGKSFDFHRFWTWWSDFAVRLEFLAPWSGDVAVGVSPGVLLPALEKVAIVPLEFRGLAVPGE